MNNARDYCLIAVNVGALCAHNRWKMGSTMHLLSLLIHLARPLCVLALNDDVALNSNGRQRGLACAFLTGCHKNPSHKRMYELNAPTNG